MPRYEFSASINEDEVLGEIDSNRIENAARLIREAAGPDAKIIVRKIEANMSRDQRAAAARDHVLQAQRIVEALARDAHEWADSMPTNLKGGVKESHILECAETLAVIAGALGDAASRLLRIEFTPMYWRE